MRADRRRLASFTVTSLAGLDGPLGDPFGSLDDHVIVPYFSFCFGDGLSTVSCGSAVTMENDPGETRRWPK